jgi:hypothetical protein
VYGLPQTRLFFEVEMVKTIVKKGPYSEYASRMLGLQNAPTTDSESWQIKSIRISDRQEVDNKQLYALSFTDYPQNLDKLLRFTKNGLILDLNVGNVLVFNQTTFSEVLKKIGRYYNVHFENHFGNELFAEICTGELILIEDFDKLLISLSELFSMQYHREGDIIYLKKK